ncbi:MlaA family lipoprotein [Kordiimonas aestuarii]|uniref:MlaA family lipoprotein n=1 Tax=Kordiimonas aestuarii TaxID=1005925 RepID=UPI0021D19D12|nr:VacJ family lipoprotein [Kordiimonas aestuarii]
MAAAALLMTTACASTHPGTASGAHDPLEPMNRAVFEFNRVTDRVLLKPVSAAYIAVVPEAPRQGVSNVMRNLREPWVFLNDLLQFKFDRAGATLGRFILNSTVGIAGLFKVSDDVGIPYHSEDFGQTLATWGIGDGPYLVLPFVGPSNGRDAIGFAANVYGDPVTLTLQEIDDSKKFFDLSLTRTAIEAFDARVRFHNEIDELYKEDDPYVVARSVYWQRRRYEIYDGAPPEPEEDLFDQLEEQQAAIEAEDAARPD